LAAAVSPSKVQWWRTELKGGARDYQRRHDKEDYKDKEKKEGLNG
jgi:hypothetical protein